MKKSILLISFLFALTSVFAEQSGNLTIYSNTGKKFFVVLNGERQNIEAQTNFQISGLAENRYSCLIIAEDKSFSVKKNIVVKGGMEYTYRLINKRKKYKLRFYSEKALNNTPDAALNVDDAESTVKKDPGSGAGEGTGGGTGNGQGKRNGGETINSTELSQAELDLTSEGITELVHGSRQGAGSGGGGGTAKGSKNGTKASADSTTVINSSEGNIYTDEDITMTLETGGCTTSKSNLFAIKETIANESYKDSRLKKAILITKNKCLTIEQIESICKEFSFSDNKLDFVKASYLNCLNQSDYSQLVKIFSFDSDKKELEKFIQSK